MSQKNPGRKVKSAIQRLHSLELRAAGASFRQIGDTLGVSRSRAFKIVAAALAEMAAQCSEKTENIRTLHLLRLDRMRMALEPRKSDPRVVTSLLQIMERESRLLGLDKPVRTEISGPDGAPLQVQEQKLDFDRLAYDELAIFAALQRKASGDADWDGDIRRYGTEEYERQWPGKPTRLLTAFVKALPFNDEPWRLAAQPQQPQRPALPAPVQP